MKANIIILVLILFAAPSCWSAEKPYDGYSQDIKLLRDNYELQSGDRLIKASTNEAISAAKRIFTGSSFLFKTGDKILDILGDPATISDYGIKTKNGKDSPLIYRFDTGWGGTEYRLIFRQNEVVGVEFYGLD